MEVTLCCRQLRFAILWLLKVRVIEASLTKDVLVRLSLMRAFPNKILQWLIISCVFCLPRGLAAESKQSDEALRDSLKVSWVNGVELHYLERGRGEVVVFVHGGLGDYREWAPAIGPFSQRYRVVAYSRRYDYPNTNPKMTDYSAVTDAKDLAGLLNVLRLRRVHLVAYSYGALGSLIYATQHPGRVHTLILAEPPVFKWLPEIPGGKAQLNHFMTALWKPAGEAFRRDRSEEALRITSDYFGGRGSYSALPAEIRNRLISDLPEWRALMTSAMPFPMADRSLVKRLKVPVLLITGEKTLPEMRTSTYELSRILPDAKLVVIPGARHDMWIQASDTCLDAALEFIAAHEQ